LIADCEIDHEKLRETVRVAVRALDNVIDVNFYPTEAARTANMRHRPVGLGVMGLQYALYAKGLGFDSAEASGFGDELMEAIALYAYEASSDLASERGTYASYAGSKWDRGLLPPDTVDLLEQERGVPVEVPRAGVLDWQALREKTTYYLRTLGASTIEKATVQATAAMPAPMPSAEAIACSIEAAMRGEECEACQ
jgi:ribonucleoside-diphosphate reductase alpha chain